MIFSKSQISHKWSLAENLLLREGQSGGIFFSDVIKDHPLDTIHNLQFIRVTTQKIDENEIMNERQKATHKRLYRFGEDDDVNFVMISLDPFPSNLYR